MMSMKSANKLGLIVGFYSILFLIHFCTIIFAELLGLTIYHDSQFMVFTTYTLACYLFYAFTTES